MSQTNWRLRLGLVILIAGLASPVLIPMVTASDLSNGRKTAISGELAPGIPEVFSIIAIATRIPPGRFFGKNHLASQVKYNVSNSKLITHYD